MQLVICLVAFFFAFAMALPQYPNQDLVNPTTLNLTELQDVVEVILESLNMTTSADNVTVTMANSPLTNATFPVDLTNATISNATDTSSLSALSVAALSSAEQLIVGSQFTGKFPGKTSAGWGSVQMSPLTLQEIDPGLYQEIHGSAA